jgi:hypothetical protein
MAVMAKVQQAGAAASIGLGNGSMKTQALNSHRKFGTGQMCSRIEHFFFLADWY